MNSMAVMRRRSQPELLDQGAGTLEDVRANLNDMWRLNRLFGGVDAIMRHLSPQMREAGQAIRIVDLGTGSAHFALYLSKWAARHGISMCVYPLDLSTRNLTIARENVQHYPAVRLIQANGLALPFARGCIDYFISSLFLHHFEPDDLITLLRHTFEYARRGIVMSDITRGELSIPAFRLIQPLVARHPFTLHDGIVSIRRAYTPDELLQLAHEAGIKTARVYRHPLWRMTLVAEK